MRPTSLYASTSSEVALRRVVITSGFVFGEMHASDAFSFKRNLCSNSHELEFLKALRLFFPNLQVHPNVPLPNFIDDEKIGGLLGDSERKIFLSSQVDVLLCTNDEDPIAGIELGSSLCNSGSSPKRDQELKNRLFLLAGVPLVHILTEDPSNVRAEDFYDLLCAESETLDKLRPRRLRPRRDHDTLVPAATRVYK